MCSSHNASHPEVGCSECEADMGLILNTDLVSESWRDLLISAGEHTALQSTNINLLLEAVWRTAQWH